MECHILKFYNPTNAFQARFVPIIQPIQNSTHPSDKKEVTTETMSVSTENQVISTSSNSIHQPSLKIDLLDIAKRHYSQTPEFSDNPRFFKSNRSSHPIHRVGVPTPGA